MAVAGFVSTFYFALSFVLCHVSMGVEVSEDLLYTGLFFMFTVEVQRSAGFHLDVEDYLMGLLQLSSEMVSVIPLVIFNCEISFFFNFIFVFPCIIIYGLIKTSLMQIV